MLNIKTCRFAYMELIDTLWNVNRFKAVASLATVSN